MHQFKALATIRKIKTNGLRWLLWRLHRELRNPTFNITIKIIDFFLNSWNGVFENWEHKETQYLYCIYDLEIAPITYNIIEYLVYVDYLSRENEGFVLVLVPKKVKKHSFLTDYEKTIDGSNQNWRIDNIIFPVARMHERCAGVFLLPDREATKEFIKNKTVFPKLYDGTNLRYYDPVEYRKTMSKPGLWTPVTPPLQGRRYVEQYLKPKVGDKKVITVTIRNYGYDTARNSNCSEWAKFIEHLLKNSYYPIIIPDTENAFTDDFPDHHDYVFRDCCWNIGLRMALYFSSYLNIGVANGPIATLLHNNKARVLIMNSSPEGSIVSSPEQMEKYGLQQNAQWKFLTPAQRLSFLPDTFENIVLEFEHYISVNG
jgi:hypothetical protein